ncbi:MAG: hypothetical protein ACRDHL_12355, partial [Candidatus Promineifilaceae bacterium]
MPSQWGKRGWAAAALLHALAIALYLDLGQVFANPPVGGTDYATHWAEVWSVSHFLDQGHLWGYDPYLLAGQPEGTLFDIDNKLVEVTSWALSKSGLSLPLSYNLTLLAILAAGPLALYPAGRLFGLGRAPALLSQMAGLALWWLDPTLRWVWQGSTLCFSVAVYAAPLVVAAGTRLVAGRGAARPRLAIWLLWFGLGGLLLWLHAASALLLALPLLALAWIAIWPRPGRSLRPAGLAALILWPPIVLALSAPWLATAIRFAGTKTTSAQFLQGGLPALAADLLGVGRVDGAENVRLLGLRWTVLAVGGLGLWLLSRRDRRWPPVAVGAWTGLA